MPTDTGLSADMQLGKMEYYWTGLNGLENQIG